MWGGKHGTCVMVSGNFDMKSLAAQKICFPVRCFQPAKAAALLFFSVAAQIEVVLWQTTEMIPGVSFNMTIHIAYASTN